MLSACNAATQNLGDNNSATLSAPADGSAARPAETRQKNQLPENELRQVESPAERAARMKWWREARFGMFVHWGLYSGLAGTWDGKPVAKTGGMEWIQNRVRADTDTYANRGIPLFNPTKDFAKHWAKLAKDAGCQYVVFTTKHHDGFALHDSTVSDFDAGSVLNRDLVKEIVTALRAEGLRVGFYHSVIDWHHDQYEYNRSKQLPHPLRGKPYPNGERNHEKYVDFLHAQAEELFSNYGPIDIVWWDYSSIDFQGTPAWRAFNLIDFVRRKQPKIIMNNRLFRKPEAGFGGMGMTAITKKLDPQFGDFITPEQHVPDSGIPNVDWESCMTINTTWGYSKHDTNWKSSEQLLKTLIDVASKGGNFLLNIGPLGDGSIPDECSDPMRVIGEWLKINGGAVYGTTVSPLGKLPWGRCTLGPTKDGVTTLFMHVFDWPENGLLTVPLESTDSPSASLLATKTNLKTTQKTGQLTIQLPTKAVDPVCTVVVLKVKLQK